MSNISMKSVDHFKKKWPPMLIRGPSIGKNTPRVERRYIRIDLVGTIFITMLLALPSRPITPKIKPMTLPKKPMMVLGILVKAFLVLSLTLYQRLRSSKIISKT